MAIETYPFPTLPDYLVPGLDLVFVGINPAVYAVQKGHYFARKTNRFWPAFSRSRLSAQAKVALGLEVLGAEDDALLLKFGIGFTDVVKKPSSNASQLSPADYQEWAPRLLQRLAAHRPRVACFHGVTGYREFARYVLGIKEAKFDLGLQQQRIGDTLIFVVPNPSGANAHFTPDDQVEWYDQLANLIENLVIAN